MEHPGWPGIGHWLVVTKVPLWIDATCVWLCQYVDSGITSRKFPCIKTYSGLVRRWKEHV